MISTENLQMVPPLLVQEKTYGWYPPAYHQYSKAPYKSMAVLDDYSLFKNNFGNEKPSRENLEDEPVLEQGGTVLSSKLNAIRQDLTRRRIDPSIIRTANVKKYDSINQYMNISPNWKPKYPLPSFEEKIDCQIIHSAPILTESRAPILGEKNAVEGKFEENTKMHSKDDQFKIENQKPSPSERPSEIKGEKINRAKPQRPHSAPDTLWKTNKHIPRTPASTTTRIQSANISRNQKTNVAQQLSKSKAARSQSANQLKTYEDDLLRYKWMMEIPGDPFNIKQPHIPEKQPYFHKIDDCVILPPEIRMTKQNRDTFFHNTQPSQSMSFDISPHFTSEKYNQMKNVLRSQGKWNYSSKNFSFVY